AGHRDRLAAPRGGGGAGHAPVAGRDLDLDPLGRLRPAPASSRPRVPRCEWPRSLYPSGMNAFIFVSRCLPLRALSHWRAGLALCALACLAACGGGHRETSAVPAPGLTVPAPGLAAPSALSYATPQALYFLGEAIAHNTAQVTGGAAADFSVSPALPAGLSLDPASGLLSGTPTALQRQREHTVTARNAAGSAQATLRLTVTGRGSWTATAPHAVPRHYGGMVSLSDGSVLVAGGFAAGGETDSDLLYQPAADSWRSVSSLLE